MKVWKVLGAIALAMAVGGCDTIEAAFPATPQENPRAARAVTAETLQAITFRSDKLVREPDGRWTTYYGNGQVKEAFIETGRTATTVELRDRYQSLSFTIDLGSMELKLPQLRPSDPTSIPIASVSSAPSSMYAADGVTGRNVMRVRGADGIEYVKGFKGVWYADGQYYSPDILKEIGRDEFSVYLDSTKGRGQVQLDLHRNKVLAGAPGAPLVEKSSIEASFRRSPAGDAAAAAFAAMRVTDENVQTIVFGEKIMARRDRFTWATVKGGDPQELFYEGMGVTGYDMLQLTPVASGNLIVDLGRGVVITDDGEVAIESASEVPYQGQ